MTKTIFITGATGSIGRELVRIILEKTQDQLILMVRPKPAASHEERIEKLLKKMGINGNSKSRLRVVAGDLTQPRLGLDAGDWNTVVRETDEFYHIAALTNLGAAWEEAEKINLQGTVHVIELAREARTKGKLDRFFYYSTAYVAGSLTAIHALEDALTENPSFANSYEATKFLAEKKVREEGESFPITIFRPSIVVGDSEKGAISDFNVIYPFIRLFAHGHLRRIPSRLEHAFNIVPIDFVVKASFAISRQESSRNKTYHLVSENPATLGMLLELKDEYGHFPSVEVVAPENFSLEDLDPNEKEIFSSLDPYLGYLGSTLSFDTRNTKEALEKTGILLPVTDRAFLKRIIDYAIEKGYFLKSI